MYPTPILHRLAPSIAVEYPLPMLLPDAARGAYRLDVLSIGTATPSVHRPIVTLTGETPSEVIRRLYRAPSVLVPGVTEEFGTQVGAVLQDAGLEVRVSPLQSPFDPGIPDQDVAVHLPVPSRFRAVATELAGFLGSDLTSAATLLWSPPGVVLGSVSAATVGALRRRLEPLGAEVVGSNRDQARYDLFVGACDTGTRSIVVNTLRSLGKEEGSGPLLATGLLRAEADQFWARLERSAPLRLVNQDFQRFDVRLEKANPSPELESLLVKICGMPPAIARKVLSRLPMVLLAGVGQPQAFAALGALHEQGATATASLITFQRFDLEITEVADEGKAAETLAALTQTEARAWRRRTPFPVVGGPYPRIRALWMREELKAAGVKCRLDEK